MPIKVCARLMSHRRIYGVFIARLVCDGQIIIDSTDIQIDQLLIRLMLYIGVLCYSIADRLL